MFGHVCIWLQTFCKAITIWWSNYQIIFLAFSMHLFDSRVISLYSVLRRLASLTSGFRGEFSKCFFLLRSCQISGGKFAYPVWRGRPNRSIFDAPWSKFPLYKTYPIVFRDLHCMGWVAWIDCWSKSIKPNLNIILFRKSNIRLVGH